MRFPPSSFDCSAIQMTERAEYNGRSKNRAIEMLIWQRVRDFEKEHGKIEAKEDI